MLVSDWEKTGVFVEDGSLNPCFSGCWSRTLLWKMRKLVSGLVLILVLVDVGLGPCTEALKAFSDIVLILVLVDVGLGPSYVTCLTSVCGVVLILVLVDVGLGRLRKKQHVEWSKTS